MEKHYTERVSCSKETKTILTKDCIKEFKRLHPTLRNMKITHGMILAEVVDYYMRT